ncbi:MAG: alpha/beta hydrolase [Phycisphaeraceae bacterium]
MTTMLHHDRVTQADAAPEKWLLMLHGIFGTGRNWSHVARQVVERRPDWGVVLVDLPEHGKSTKVKAKPTLDGAADALLEFVEAEQIAAAGVLGHSFGGKVALRYAELADGLSQAWIADSSPESAEPTGHGWGMLNTVRRLPGPFADREEAVAALMDQGVAEPVARWMAMNLVRRQGDGMVWRFDIDRIERLLRDFYAADLWNVVERDTNGLRLEFIKADDSDVLSPSACRRINDAAKRNPRLHLHHVPGGHWLNVESPAAVVDLLADRLVH